MKYLKRFKLFVESSDFKIEDSDSSDVKISKERLNKIKKHLGDYKQKKNKIETLYKKDDVSSDELIKIIGKDEEENDFLREYANIVSMERKLYNLKNKEDLKNAELSNMKLRLDNANDESKESIQNAINNLTNNINEIKSKIDEINKNLPDLEKKHEVKMKNIEKEIQEYIKNIQISDLSDIDGEINKV